jgi:hypothetical protein
MLHMLPIQRFEVCAKRVERLRWGKKLAIGISLLLGLIALRECENHARMKQRGVAESEKDTQTNALDLQSYGVATALMVECKEQVLPVPELVGHAKVVRRVARAPTQPGSAR